MSFDNEHTEPYEIEFGNYDYICQHYLFGKTIKLRIKIVYIENEPWGELNNELWDCIDKVLGCSESSVRFLKSCQRMFLV